MTESEYVKLTDLSEHLERDINAAQRMVEHLAVSYDELREAFFKVALRSEQQS